jgi:hypothetical protein
MSTLDEMHVGEALVDFRGTLYDENGAVVDLSATSSFEIIFSRPGGASSFTKTASFLTDGTDGVGRYLCAAEDINMDGTWRYQFRAEWATGKLRYSSTIGFVALETLDDT